MTGSIALTHITWNFIYSQVYASYIIIYDCMSDGSLGSLHRWRSQRIAKCWSCELQDTSVHFGLWNTLLTERLYRLQMTLRRCSHLVDCSALGWVCIIHIFYFHSNGGTLVKILSIVHLIIHTRSGLGKAGITMNTYFLIANMYTTHTHTLQHSHVGWALTWESCAVLCIIHSALTRESNAVYSIYAVGCVHWILLAVVFGRTHAHITGG